MVPKQKTWVRLKKNFIRYRYIYLMLIPIVIYYAVFCYAPMGGVVIAFQNFKPALGIAGSEWVGFKHFVDFLTGPYAWRLIRNTLLINVLQILFAFPVPIIIALLINEIQCKKYKKVVQTISYMPHFISLVVMCGLLVTFCRSDGIFNDFLALFGVERQNLLANAGLFRPLYVLSGIWQEAGWGSIIYLATLSTIDPGLYEAATIDGANRFQRMLYVSFPGLVPIIIVQLIMRIGNILTTGFEKVFLLYSPLTYDTADIISTYIYRQGLELSNYSYGTAVGIFNSIVNLIILILANYISRRATEESLW
ncbi:MAG TPA: ABC transporter permease subunit [Candidatus Eisenbergiella intestinipullorum]|nr:ABC transporter permease subunit [Candidatus Eisenbergiella intestinipullorum]